MKVPTFAALLTSLALLAGCVSTVKTTDSTPVYNDLSGTFPKVNNVAQTGAGSILYTEFNYTVSPTIVLNTNCPTHRAEIPKAEKLVAVKVKNTRVYVYHDKDDGEYGELYYLTDRDSNNKIDQYKTYSGPWTPVDPEIEYTSGEPVLADQTGYKLELIYLGTSDGVMELSYREFKDDYSKPALTKVAGYAINQIGPTTIAFKGAEIQILRATSDEIKYKVLKGFNR